MLRNRRIRKISTVEMLMIWENGPIMFDKDRF